MLSREGTGGIIPPDNMIPIFAASDNHLHLTRIYTSAYQATVRLGTTLCHGFGTNTLESIPQIMRFSV
jgi:hypothetical protein